MADRYLARKLFVRLKRHRRGLIGHPDGFQEGRPQRAPYGDQPNDEYCHAQELHRNLLSRDESVSPHEIIEA